MNGATKGHEHQARMFDDKLGRERVLTVYEEGSSLTQQQWKDDCDINKIIKRYTETGVNPHPNLKGGVYADLTNLPDYQGMLDATIYAQEAFMTLPAEARARFQNNPAELIEFMRDPEKNYDEGVKLGLFEKKSEPTVESLASDKTTNKTMNNPAKSTKGTESKNKNPSKTAVDSSSDE